MGVYTAGNIRRVVLGLGDTSIASGFASMETSARIVFANDSDAFNEMSALVLAGEKEIDISKIPGEIVVIDFTKKKSVANTIRLLQEMLDSWEGEL